MLSTRHHPHISSNVTPLLTPTSNTPLHNCNTNSDNTQQWVWVKAKAKARAQVRAKAGIEFKTTAISYLQAVDGLAESVPTEETGWMRGAVENALEAVVGEPMLNTLISTTGGRWLIGILMGMRDGNGNGLNNESN